jgi:hypothetical protein
MGFGPEGAFGAFHPRLRFVQLPLPEQHGCAYHAGHAEGGLAAPTVPLGQLDGCCGALGTTRKRLVVIERALVGETRIFEIRSADLTGQGEANFQVAFRVIPRRPKLSGAETDQRKGTQIRPEAGLRRFLGHGRQSLCLFGHPR